MKSSNKDKIFSFLSENCHDVVVKESKITETIFLFSVGKFRASEEISSSSFLVFVAIGKRMALSTGHEIDCTALVERCRTSIPDKGYVGIAKGLFTYAKLKPKDKPNKVLRSSFIAKTIKECKRLGADNCSGILVLRKIHNRLFTSAGINLGEEQHRFYFSLNVSSKLGYCSHRRICGRDYNLINSAKMAKAAVKEANSVTKPRPLPEGRCNILFSPNAFAHLLSVFSSHFSAISVEGGFSCLGGKIGKSVAGKCFTLFDDALHPNGFFSSLFDDEGRPTKKITLVKNGTLLTYMHNTSSAKRFKTKPTGHAGLMNPLPYNLVVKPGTFSFKKMLTKLKNGIYVTDLRYTTFSRPILGEFSTLPCNAAFLVKNGKIVGSVEKLRIKSNVLETMKGISKVGKKPENVFGWEIQTPVITPHVLVRNLEVSCSN